MTGAWVVFAALAAGGDWGVTVIPAASPLVDWRGRVQRNADGSVEFDWLGAQLQVRLSGGTYLKGTFNTSGTRHVRLRTFVTYAGDYPLQHTEVALHRATQEYVLAADYPPKGTVVTVVNNQEAAYMGRSARLVSLETDGTILPPPPAMTRRLEFVGDSITAGTNLRRPAGDPAYGIPQGPACADGGLFSDYPQSYSGLLCEALDANCSTIAWGGKGLYVNCCDKGATLPDYFQMRLALQGNAPANRYSFNLSGFAPDAVVVNLGTNDFSGCSHFSPDGDGCGPKFQAAFVQTYVAFMHNVTRWYGKPDIHFFAGVGPITLDYLNVTTAAVEQATREGLQATLVDQQACAQGGGGCQ
eukprot:Hpha_TRINITY_DN5719_c0_g1::TRINITY_DN5719_c0_g1_i1::g.147600::m.147600